MSSSPHSAAKHMFYYLLVLFTLSFTAIGLGQILFQVVNAVFIEPAASYDASYSDWVLRFGLSSVIIGAPVYWLITHIINQELQKRSIDRDSAVRKWLTYLILLISSMTVIGFLIGVLNSFLSGELTVKFILKTLSALLIAGVVFSYYFYDIRRERFEDGRTIVIFRSIFGSVVVLTVILGFFFNTSPSILRSLRQDGERVNRLRNIGYQVTQSYQENKVLPKDLSVIDGKVFQGELSDPVSSEAFSYRVIDKKSYELCGVFELSNKDKKLLSSEVYQDPDWLHGSGKQCFQKKVEDMNKPGF